MDSLTHVALGAVIGEVLLSKKIGKKALAIGAFAQYFPDVDVIASLWLPPAENLLAHRGITHSFLFAGSAAILFAYVAFRLFKKSDQSFLNWILFFLIQLLIHSLIDAFNAYGVGWFQPFLPLRISINTIYVVDPFLTLWIVVTSVVLVVTRSTYIRRHTWAMSGLIIFTGYLAYASVNKVYVNHKVEEDLRTQHISFQRYFTTPTPFNVWLWYIVAEDTAGYYIGYRSVFDSKTLSSFEYFPKNDSLLRLAKDKDAIPYLKRFSQGYYTLSYQDQKLVLNDLRYGQIAGWQNPRAPFVFYYYLDSPDENLMVIQRGRVAGWDKNSVQSLITRIKGN